MLHAESNLITKLAKSTIGSEGITIYITLSPCFECSKLIYQCGVKKVVYLEDYRKNNGIEFLKKCGIEVVKYE